MRRVTTDGHLRSDDGEHDIGFILIPGFALMSFASATEPFRAANTLAARPLYRLRFFGEGTEGRVASSSGAEVPVEPLPSTPDGLKIVFVCAGGEPATWHRPAVHASLRRLARFGTCIGGISGGSYLLAAAGLLSGRSFTVHWEHAASLMEDFPHLRPQLARFVISGNLVTCGGGVAPIDMAHALIAERMGGDFAQRISDWFLHTAVALPEDPQRALVSERYGIHHPALATALETMERTIAAPLDRKTIAGLAGVSERHLDRLFLEKRRRSFSQQYRELRLHHARLLLRQSVLQISAIALATGFPNAAHFSRSYRAHFGHSPTMERRAQ